jgi:hypothetical protein
MRSWPITSVLRLTEQVERMRRTQARIINLRTLMELDIGKGSASRTLWC